MLEKFAKKKYTLNDLYTIVEKGNTDSSSLNIYERKLKNGFLFDYTYSQLEKDCERNEVNRIDPHFEQLIFGSPVRRKVIAEQIGEYNRIKTMQIIEWYDCWLKGK